jgi:exopolyphosphatase/guanosine-5'-triphosphate,3'-diphosphate pyrophosphatase
VARVAAIDVGSNSVKIHVAELGNGARWKTLADQTEITRLGEGLRDTGAITPPAMARTLEALGRFVSTARTRGAERIAAVGTMCLREAANSEEFLMRARETLGLEIEVIDGEEEARLSYLAIISGLPLPQGVIAFDTGGGSTEFIVGRGSVIELRFSLNLGSVALTQEFLRSDPVTPDELSALLAHLAPSLRPMTRPGKRFTMVGMGGTLTSMAAVKLELAVYDPERVHGSMLTRADVEAQVAQYRKAPIDERRSIVGLHPKRADVILAGAAIVLAILRHLDMDHLLVSDRGLRHGLIFDRFVAPAASTE